MLRKLETQMKARQRIGASILIVATTFLAVPPALAKDVAIPPETLRVSGLHAAAEIRLDRWGVPHLYASSEVDLFYGQGFNAARDRLFQIDLWRRRGLGQLSEVFGPGFLEPDRGARLFLYRADMDRGWRIDSARGGREAEPVARRSGATGSTSHCFTRAGPFCARRNG
jgi:penicillin amidase